MEFCEIDGLACAPPLPDTPALSWHRHAWGSWQRLPLLCRLDGRGAHLVAEALRAGRTRLPFRWGLQWGNERADIAVGELDLSTARTGPGWAEADLLPPPNEQLLAELLPIQFDLEALGLAPISVWLDGPDVDAPAATQHPAWPVGQVLSALLAAHGGMTLASDALGAQGPWATLAITSAGRLCGHPDALPGLSLGQLIEGLHRQLALGAWLDGNTLHVEPLAAAFDAEVCAELTVAAELCIEGPDPELAHAALAYGSEWVQATGRGGVPELHGPRRAALLPHAAGAATAARSLRSPWLTDPAALERLRLWSAESVHTPVPTDGVWALLDLEWAPRPELAGALGWQLRRGHSAQHGLVSQWALSSAVQLRRWAPLLVPPGTVLAPDPAPGTSLRAGGPDSRHGVSYLLRGQPYSEPTDYFDTHTPFTPAVRWSGRCLTAQLRLEPPELSALAAAVAVRPQARLRLRTGGPGYVEGYLHTLAITPASRAVQLMLRLPA